MKFEIGDRVRIEEKGGKHCGEIGVIEHFDTEYRPKLRMEGGGHLYIYAKNLVKIDKVTDLSKFENLTKEEFAKVIKVEDEALEKLKSDEKVVELQKLLAEKNEEIIGINKLWRERKRVKVVEYKELEDKYNELMLKYQTKKADIEVLKREAGDYMMFHTMEDKPELIEFVKHRLEFVEADHDNNVVKFMDNETHLPIDITTATLVFLEGNEVCLFKGYEDYNDIKYRMSDELKEKLNDSYEEHRELCVKYIELESKKDFIIDALVDKCRKK